MRYAVIADIHANLAALTAVLEDIERKGDIDEIWCLGDIVGYGPDPAECIELVRRYRCVCIAGNHDRAAAGEIDTRYFNAHADAAIRWTSAHLTEKDTAYLANLPLTVEKGDFLLVHGSPMDNLFEYIIGKGIAERNFGFFQSRYCLVGHSHVPLAFKKGEEGCLPVSLSPGVGVVLGSARMILNPGGVGQPRDGDPRASYAVYDGDGHIFRLFRVEYDIEATQDRIMQAGLPVHLATRLKEGK